MKHAWGIPLILALAACYTPPPERDPNARPPMGGDDVKDHVMPLNAAEPPWRDIIRHTVLPPPGTIPVHIGAPPDPLAPQNLARRFRRPVWYEACSPVHGNLTRPYWIRERPRVVRGRSCHFRSAATGDSRLSDVSPIHPPEGETSE